MRDDFKQAEVTKLARQSGYICSNPSCRRATVGPDGNRGSASIGVAAHSTAAAAGGPSPATSCATATRWEASGAGSLEPVVMNLLDLKAFGERISA